MTRTGLGGDGRDRGTGQGTEYENIGGIGRDLESTSTALDGIVESGITDLDLKSGQSDQEMAKKDGTGADLLMIVVIATERGDDDMIERY